ncbi:MAG: hypothetical protein V1676_05870 [Candidatus Diapherotrites archaeon]
MANIRELLAGVIVLLAIIAILLFFTRASQPTETAAVANSLAFENSRLKFENDQLQSRIGGMADKVKNVEMDYAELQQKRDEDAKRCAASVQPPYVLWKGRKATAVFRDINSELQQWVWDANVLENAMQAGWYKREVLPEMIIPFLSNQDSTYAKKLKSEALGFIGIKMKDGRIERVADVRPFVTPEAFKDMVGTIAGGEKSDEQVIMEIWNLNRQLSTYSAELTETPRYPAETLSLGGGDCEDTVILVASLLRAVPREWKVQVVYMDFDNPAEPKEVNHMAVYVNTGTYSTIIETTNKEKLNPFGADVNGWYFDV